MIPFARIRRQSPRDSPSSTREFGPIDATIRDCLLAPERTITQCRDTDRTQRDTGRLGGDEALVVADATDVAGFATVFAGV